MALRKVALVVNADKSLATATAGKIVDWLQSRGTSTLLHHVGAATLHRLDLAEPDAGEWTDVEMVLVLGGDGTLIRAAQMVAPMQIPILGINTGHLGFLTEIESSEVEDSLESLLDGNFVTEERLMLTARVLRGGQEVLRTTALNDAVVSKGPRARLVHLDVSIGGTSVARYRADGVVVSTPTGSTAYSLSAGGPIVNPTVDVLLITPICPHTMNSRAMVISGSEEVCIRVAESPGEVGLSADGSDPFELKRGDHVRVSRAPNPALLVRRTSYRFYDVLRQKLSDPAR